ncbi:MAG TPA: M20/M25/M40 family metallo-hydrolase, partial [Thermomicrobiales bacterium]|nr:M20/M25/M40 family metallo-hydrolase [Thermomicrobiales bacterium]
ALVEAAAQIPGIRYEYEYRTPLAWLEPTEVGADAPLTVACQEAFHRATGREIVPSAFAGASDAYPFQFIAGIPTIAAFGPGLLTPAHGPNEWISLQSLLEAPAIYAELILTYLDPARTS